MIGKIRIGDPKEILSRYLPQNMQDRIAELIRKYPVKVKIVPPRKCISGTHSVCNGAHTITVNGDLNPYQFALTLLHEIAHLQTSIECKARGHGQEWKTKYGQLIKEYLLTDLTLPADIAQALQGHLSNIKSTDVMDVHLTKTLHKYDKNAPSEEDLLPTLEEIPFSSTFLYDGKLMRKEKLLRKYYLCQEVNTNKKYRCYPLMRVEIVNK